MARDLTKTLLYHITDVRNLASTLQNAGLHSDAVMRGKGGPTVAIGYDHIKERRLTKYKIACVDDRFVGEFVPFYYCPRSPMLFVINNGHTNRPVGCQSSIVHLVTTVKLATDLEKAWAITDGNAGSDYFEAYNSLNALDRLDWDAIETDDWKGQTQHFKMAEFLVADFYPWSSIIGIGCHNNQTAAQVVKLMAQTAHQPKVVIRPSWYFR